MSLLLLLAACVPSSLPRATDKLDSTDSEPPTSETSTPTEGTVDDTDIGTDDTGAVPLTDTDADTGTVATETADTGATTEPASPRFTVVTFNTGTTEGLAHDTDGDGYGDDQVTFSDSHYGNGLAWMDAVDDVTAWFATLKPDVVVFQEIFYSEDCAAIPANAQVGYVCESFSTGDPTVASALLGTDYQVACHPGKTDKCIGVRKAFGTIRQCSDPDFCLEGLDGESVADCGSGARVARATIDLVQGDEITVVNVHGTSGVSDDDIDCRVDQVRQVFEDMDGEPGANGARNVVLGDLNVDPGRIPAWLENSVDQWEDHVGGSNVFQWVSPMGWGATPTYAGIANIDHVASDVFTGSCYSPGVDGVPAVYPNVLFDHMPLVCDLGDLF